MRRALRVRKKTGGENNPVGMIGDILAAELSHMQPYIRFCSCQFNGATLLQTRTDNDSDFKDFMRVGRIPTSCPLPMSFMFSIYSLGILGVLVF